MSAEMKFGGKDPVSTCSRCGSRFTCDMLAGESECWCTRLPKLPLSPDPALGCYCPRCLAQMLRTAGPGFGPS